MHKTDIIMINEITLIIIIIIIIMNDNCEGALDRPQSDREAGSARVLGHTKVLGGWD